MPNFPTLIVCGFCAMAAFLSLFSGLILQSLMQKDKQAFEFRLQLADGEYKRRLALGEREREGNWEKTGDKEREDENQK